MWMFCVVVLYSLATGDTFPFLDKGMKSHDKKSFVKDEFRTDKQTNMMITDSLEEQLERTENMTFTGKELLHNSSANMAHTTENSETNNKTVHHYDVTDLDSVKDIEIEMFKSNNTNENVTSDKLNSKNITEINIYNKNKNSNNHISSYLIHLPYYLQKYVQRENPLKGFLRETILVPGHRKERHRRSSFFDFGFPMEEEETDVIFSAHTSPCNWADRYYCLNRGTCVFVHALEIKTCR